MADYTTTALLTSIKRRAMLSTSAESLDTSDYLAFATEELQSYIADLLIEAKEEYLVYSETSAVTSGTANYRIPERAVGVKLRDLLLLVGDTYVSLPRIEETREEEYAASGAPAGYKLEGNNVVLIPSPSSSYTLKFVYYRRPNALVATTAVGTITALASSAPWVATISGITGTSLSGRACDLIRAKSGFEWLAIDQTPTAVASGTVTFASFPTGLAVGDYVCVAGESPVAQIPVELHPLLAQRVVVKALEAFGDPKLATAKTICDEMRTQLMTVLTNRVEGSARIIINKYAPGFGRTNSRWRR